MPKRAKLRLDQIEVDQRIQARAKLDEDTLADYVAAIERGDKLPAVTVFHDGRRYWLASGFHRVEATRRAGKKEIAVEVERGDRQAALWHSLGANRTNGLRLTREDKARAVKLALELHPDMSDRAIAAHVGCDHKTVAKHRGEPGSRGEFPTCQERTGLDGKTYSAPPKPVRSYSSAPSGQSSRPADPAAAAAIAADLPPSTENPEEDLPPSADDDPDRMPDPIEDGELADDDHDQASGRRAAPRQAAGPVDHAGNRIPNQAIAEAFRRADELNAICTEINKLKGRVLALCEKHDPLVVFITESAFTADANNMRRHIAEAKPYAVCPYCAGDGCKACKGGGWVNETTWNMAPQEMRDQLKNTKEKR